jgi:hypothetical protein
MYLTSSAKNRLFRNLPLCVALFGPPVFALDRLLRALSAEGRYCSAMVSGLNTLSIEKRQKGSSVFDRELPT